MPSEQTRIGPCDFWARAKGITELVGTIRCQPVQRWLSLPSTPSWTSHDLGKNWAFVGDSWTGWLAKSQFANQWTGPVCMIFWVVVWFMLIWVAWKQDWIILVLSWPQRVVDIQLFHLRCTSHRLWTWYCTLVKENIIPDVSVFL